MLAGENRREKMDKEGEVLLKLKLERSCHDRYHV
jgi:hypothetical protein